jgi:hypothetical protein
MVGLFIADMIVNFGTIKRCALFRPLLISAGCDPTHNLIQTLYDLRILKPGKCPVYQAMA